MTLLTATERQPSKIGSPDLSANADNLEWWFAHGSIEGRNLPRQHFMLSFFRQSVPRGQTDGHMLLVALLDAAAQKPSVASWVSRQLLETFNREAPEKVKKAQVDQIVAGAILSEIAKGGPPRPIEVIEEEAVVAVSPLSIRWRDFKFAQCGDSLGISFAFPGTDRICRLAAEPQKPWFEGRDLGGEKAGYMAYDCCPRLKLTGEVDGEPVSGTAWVDHQWGGDDWITSPENVEILPGWDWLGINLDNGSDLIVMVHRDMRSREPVAQFAVYFAGSGKTHRIDNVTITGKSTWRSPATMVDYPTRCVIDVPELALSIEFEPLTDGQEIPVFGLNSAIWQGAGKIAGTIAGRTVTGTARLELHGYGSIAEFDAYQEKWVGRLDRIIAGFLPRQMSQDKLVSYLGTPRWTYSSDTQNRMLSEPVWDLLSRGGKHWRPMFSLLLLEALGIDPSPYELMLSTISELIHNGSVIIDDIEDSSPMRRGGKTLHLRYGLPTAINAGNTLYFLPLLTVAQNADLTIEQKYAIYQLTIDMMVQAHFGQAQDLDWGQHPPDALSRVLCDPETRQLILQAHAFKSAAAVKGIADTACIIAKTTDEVREACIRLAESWGVAFQITDDIKNFSTSSRWGKQRGEDLRDGKVTYVTHNAVQMLAGADKNRLLEIMTTSELRQSEGGLSEGIALIERSGALEASRRDAENLYMADWPAVSRILPNSQAKLMLRAMLDKL